MAKVKDNNAPPLAEMEAELGQVRAELDQARSERDGAVEGREILQQFLDWCGMNHARVVWVKNGRGQTLVRIRVDHMEVEQAYTDPIQGALEAMALMEARMARRRVNAGI